MGPNPCAKRMRGAASFWCQPIVLRHHPKLYLPNYPINPIALTNFWYFYLYIWIDFFLEEVADQLPLREMVKTVVLRQDPPFRKRTGALFVYPPPSTLKDGVLFV